MLDNSVAAIAAKPNNRRRRTINAESTSRRCKRLPFFVGFFFRFGDGKRANQRIETKQKKSAAIRRAKSREGDGDGDGEGGGRGHSSHFHWASFCAAAYSTQGRDRCGESDPLARVPSSHFLDSNSNTFEKKITVKKKNENKKTNDATTMRRTRRNAAPFDDGARHSTVKEPIPAGCSWIRSLFDGLPINYDDIERERERERGFSKRPNAFRGRRNCRRRS